MKINAFFSGLNVIGLIVCKFSVTNKGPQQKPYKHRIAV